VLLGAVLTLLLAISIPLSTSRSSTVLAAVFLTIALGHLIVTVVRRRPNLVLGRVAGIVLAAVLAVGAIGFLGRHIIAQRLHLTSVQLNRLAEEGTLTSRWVLYTDTWRMAVDRPAFGWGLGSYAPVFQRYNTQQSTDRLPIIYVDAHSDWLQSLAETGFTGTTLLGLLIIIPIITTLRHRPGPLPAYLLAGCGLILLYAWIEFPFGCPAVIAAFWTILFSATRLAQLDAHDRHHTPRSSLL